LDNACIEFCRRILGCNCLIPFRADCHKMVKNKLVQTFDEPVITIGVFFEEVVFSMLIL
jgi:hypothetical protein